MKMQVCENFDKFLDVEGYVTEEEWVKIADYLKKYYYETNCLDLSRIKNISIPNYAFQNIASLREVILPEQLTTIGDGAFQNCISLRRINMPVELKNIGEQAFYKCNLQGFYAPKQLRNLGDYALGGNKNLSIVKLNKTLIKNEKAFSLKEEHLSLEA